MRSGSLRDRVLTTHMAEETAQNMNETAEAAVSRVYEIGYLVSPAVAEENIEKVVSSIRSLIEKAGGSFIAEGAPTLLKLAYDMSAIEGGKRVDYDRGYFGWLKFEVAVSGIDNLDAALKLNTQLLRHILFQTVREDTRAKIKLGTLREVKRSEPIQAKPRRTEEVSAPVSEEDLEKALQDITAE